MKGASPFSLVMKRTTTRSTTTTRIGTSHHHKYSLRNFSMMGCAGGRPLAGASRGMFTLAVRRSSKARRGVSRRKGERKNCARSRSLEERVDEGGDDRVLRHDEQDADREHHDEHRHEVPVAAVDERAEELADRPEARVGLVD